MRKIFTLFIILIIGILLATSCKKKKIRITGRDTSIDTTNAYNKIFLDSLTLRGFMQNKNIPENTADRIISFYNTRNYAYAWFSTDELPEQTITFWNILKNYIGYSGDSALYDKRLAQKMEKILVSDNLKAMEEDDFKQIEMELTHTFFNYASKAYEGKEDFDMKYLEWFIPRKKVNITALLDSLIANRGQKVDSYEPINEQYRHLRQMLLKYKNIQTAGGWNVISGKGKTFKKGDTAVVIAQLKKRLHVEGFYGTDTTQVFYNELAPVINEVRVSYGLAPTGKIDAQFLGELNVSAGNRAEQILINMERMRWLPDNVNANYIMVNIPEYVLYVYENNKPAWKMNVVVGKEGTNTTVFAGKLNSIVFSPYWVVPTSIVKKEIMPVLNDDYLAKNHMEIYGNAGSVPLIRQIPGPWNSLGLVKFLFPNSFDIYFHDSPAKSLFYKDRRNFSHGCIRLKEPFKLAQYLLRDDKRWDSLKIIDAMNNGEEQYVYLKTPVPVLITYFTAWVGDNGKLNFRQDIYGHDKKMAEKMFVHNNNIQKIKKKPLSKIIEMENRTILRKTF